MSAASNTLSEFVHMSVPNIQALAANLSGDVPARYVRPDEAEQTVVPPDSGDQLPVIDLSRLALLDSNELSRLRFACRHWGFFQVINHGVPEEIIEKIKHNLSEFFKLPLKEKEAVKQLPGKIEGYGQLFAHSEQQKLDWSDFLFLNTHPPQSKDMKFWPTKPIAFRDTLDRYTLEIRQLARHLATLMAKDLGLKKHEMWVNLLCEQRQTVRINYYPPCKHASKVLGLSPHSDAVGLTVLLQVNDVDGLQIMKEGKWFSVKAKQGAFIVNIGDFIEIMSNGKYKSIEHRVIVDPKKERLSIATFHSAFLDTVMRPFPELLKDEEERYKAITVEDYRKLYFLEKLDGKRLLESLKK